MIEKNLNSIRQQIAEAAVEAGLEAADVALIAVSKTKPLELIKEAAEAGQLDFGENRVQELVEKNEQLPHLHWHMIGVLQRNKVKYIAPFIHLIHSVDSDRLLKEIDKRAAQNDRSIAVLLQLNISHEAQKSGMELEEARSILENIEDYPHIEIKGLMGMAEFTDDMEVVGKQFGRLKEASESLKSLESDRVSLQELSMGMSGDFPVAIAKGSTMVRVGSAIFGSRY